MRAGLQTTQVHDFLEPEGEGKTLDPSDELLQARLEPVPLLRRAADDGLLQTHDQLGQGAGHAGDNPVGALLTCRREDPVVADQQSEGTLRPQRFHPAEVLQTARGVFDARIQPRGEQMREGIEMDGLVKAGMLYSKIGMRLPAARAKRR